MEAIVRVKQKGQVTMPASVREALSLQEGDLLRVVLEGRRIILEPVVQGRPVAVPFDARRLGSADAVRFRLANQAAARNMLADPRRLTRTGEAFQRLTGR